MIPKSKCNFLLLVSKRGPTLISIGRFETEEDALKYTSFLEKKDGLVWTIAEIKCQGVNLNDRTHDK